MGRFFTLPTFEEIFKSYKNRPSHVKGGFLLYKLLKKFSNLTRTPLHVK
jgi:hypothetical protein